MFIGSGCQRVWNRYLYKPAQVILYWRTKMVEIIPIQIRTSLATLAVNGALIIQSAHGSAMTRAFLGKHVRMDVWLESPDAEDAILVGMSQGEASTAQIKTAVEQVQIDTDLKQQGAVRDVLFETTRVLHANVNAEAMVVRIDVTLGGGKGIPFEVGGGFQWFAYNAGLDDQVSGAVVVGEGSLTGIWL